MKTTKFVTLGLLGFSFSISYAQNNIQTATLTSIGLEAGTSASGSGNSFYGYRAGKNSTGGINNTLIGTNAGQNITGVHNTVIGSGALINNDGDENTIIGTSSGMTSGSGNIAIGYRSGLLDEGFNNVFIGNDSGAELLDGSNNLFIGNGSGPEGGDLSVSNKLFIDNMTTNIPLIWGDFELNQLKFNSKVGIGYGFGNYPITAGNVNIANYNLFVKGGILTEEVRISLQTTWADYVFKKDYKLPSLQEVEKHITEKGHLINVPTAEEVACNGIELGEMTKIQQEKIEELTLYIIEQNKINEKQATQLANQGQEIAELKAILNQLLDKQSNSSKTTNK